MSKEKQIEEMTETINDLYGADAMYYGVDSYGIATALYNARYRKQEWISVEDRLPEESGEYLVFGQTFGNKKPQIWICECISIGSVMGWCNNAKNPIVEAWMPLPKAPKMKGGEE